VVVVNSETGELKMS